MSITILLSLEPGVLGSGVQEFVKYYSSRIPRMREYWVALHVEWKCNVRAPYTQM